MVARKTLAVVMSIVLTAGLMPGVYAWGSESEIPDFAQTSDMVDRVDENPESFASDADDAEDVAAQAGASATETEDDAVSDEPEADAGSSPMADQEAADSQQDSSESGSASDKAAEKEPKASADSEEGGEERPFAKPPEDVDPALADGIDFTSCRLLVAGVYDFAEGTEVLSEYKGVTLTQYPSETQARNAYLYYKYVQGAAMVAPDTDIAAADDTASSMGDGESDGVETDEPAAAEAVPVGEASEASPSAADDPFDPGVENASPMSADDNPLAELNEELASGAGAGGYTVALVDTGYLGAGVVDSASMLGDSAADDSGHGSTMAGYILEADPNARIVSVKVLGADGRGTVSSVYAGIEYAIAAGADVINLSLSAWASADNEVVVQAIEEATASGIIVVGAAGNNGADASYTVPGCVESAVIMGACDEEGNRVFTSNYGDTVDAYAIADSTSEAAARASGALSKNKSAASVAYGGLEEALGSRFFLTATSSGASEDAPLGDDSDDQFRASTSYTATYSGNISWSPTPKKGDTINAGDTLTLKNTGKSQTRILKWCYGTSSTKYTTVISVTVKPGETKTLTYDGPTNSVVDKGSSATDGTRVVLQNKFTVKRNISLASPTGFVYGDSMAALPAISSSDSTAGTKTYYWYASNKATLLASGASMPTAAMKTWAPGTYYVKAVVSESGGWSQAESSMMPFTISKRTATLKWGNRQFTYDGTPHAPTCTVTNLVNGDSCDVTVDGEQTDAGNGYVATATALSNSSKYVLPSSRTTTFDIMAPIYPTVSIAGWTYGDSPNAPSAVSNNPGGGAVTYWYKKDGAGSSTRTTTVPTDAGDYVLEAEVAASGGYGSGTATASFTIEPATLTVTANPATKAYGDPDPSFTYMATGFKNGDTESVLTGALGRDSDESIGSHALTVGTLSAGGNYTISFTSDNLVISPLIAEIDWGATSLAYNGVNQAPAATVKNLVSGDTVNVDVSGKEKNVGTGYTATATGLSGADAANYVMPTTGTTQDFEISPLTVDLVWSNTSLTYDGTPQVPTATVSNLCGSDDCTVTVSGQQVNAASGYTATATGLSGADAANYALPPSGTATTFDIDPAQVTIIWPTPDSFPYTGSPITYGPPAAGGIVAGADVSVDVTSNTQTDVGTYTATATGLSGADAANYALPTSGLTHDWQITVPPNTATVSLAGWTYGDAPNTPSVTASFGAGTATFSYSTSQTGTYSSTVPTDAGTYWVKASIAATPSYGSAEATASFVIAPATLTVTANPASKTYGDPDPTFAYTAAGFKYSDGNEVFSGALSRVSGENVGTYALTVGTLSAGGNYTVSFVSDNLSIVKADSAVTAAPVPTDPTYIGVAQALVTAGTASGGTMQYKVGASGTWSAAIPAKTDVAAYDVYYKVVGDANHNDSPEYSLTSTISPAPLTITANATSIEYGDAPVNSGVAYAGLVGADTASALSGTLAFAYDYAQYDDVGSYTITPSGLSASNYTITFVAGTLSVNQRQITVLAGDSGGAYGANPDTSLFTYSLASGSLAAGDSLDVSYACAASSTSPAGSTHNIVPSVTAVTRNGGARDVTANYRFTYQNGTYTVGSGAPTVTPPSPITSTYDGSDQVLITPGTTTGGTMLYSLTGNGLDWSTSLPTGLNAGTYTVYYMVNGGANFANVPAATVTATINPRPAILSWTNTSFVYDAASHVPMATVSNLCSQKGVPDTCLVTVTGAETDAGSYTATASVLSNANYIIPPMSTQAFTIAPRQVNLVWANDSLVYNATAQGPTATVAAGGIVAGDTCTLSVSGQEADACVAAGVGSYTASATLSNPNYTIAPIDANHDYVIAPKTALIVWPSSNTYVYDGSTHYHKVASVSTGIAGEELEVSMYADASPNTYRATDGGTYTSTVMAFGPASTAPATNPLNYALPSNASNAWSISAVANTASVSIDDWVYGDAPNAPAVTAAFGASGAIIEYAAAVTGPYSTTVPTNAGTYWVRATIPAGTNYAGATATASFQITQREVGLNWDATSFVYNGLVQCPAATATNLVAGDTCTVTVAGGATNVGSYTVTATGLSNANYKLPANVDCDFNITRAALTIKANDNSIEYGDAPSDAGVTCTGLASVDADAYGMPSAGVFTGALSYAFSYAQYGNVGAYSITPSGLSNDNYSIVYVDGVLTVGQREVTLSWSVPASFEYDGNPVTWPEPSVGNLVNGDALNAVWASPTGSSDVYTETNVGTYSPVVASLSGAQAGNYKLPANKIGSWQITPPATNSMTLSISNWIYGTYNASVNGPVVTAAQGASTAVVTYYTDSSCTLPVASSDLDGNGVPKNVGTYWAQATIAATANYPAATATCSFDITKAQITVTADDLQSVRGDPLQTLTYTVAGGLASGDSVSSFVNIETDAVNTATGRYDITVGWANGVSSHPNYDITFTDGTYTVTRALANVSAVGWTGMYDGTDVGKEISVSVAPAGSSGNIDIYYSETSFANIVSSAEMNTLSTSNDVSDPAFVSAWNNLQSAISTGSFATSSPKYSAAGTHRVYFLVVSDQTKPDVVYGYKDVVINKAQLVVTADDAAIVYGDDAPAAPAPGVTYAGFVNGEDESVLGGTLGYTYGGYAAGSPVGMYGITPGGLTSSGYSITYRAGTLTVGKREVTFTWPDPSSLAYSGAAQTYGPPVVNNLFGSDDVTAVCTAGTDTATDVGSYTATVASLSGVDAGNYKLPADTSTLYGDWSITPATLTITANDASVTYGDAPADNGVVCTGLLGSDTISSLAGTLAYTFTYVRYGDVGVYQLTPTGLSSNNYVISFVPGVLTVSPREVTLAWPANDVLRHTGAILSYGEPALGNVVNGDDVKVGGYVGNTGADIGPYTATVTSLAGAAAGNYALPTDVSHDWTITDISNIASVSMAGWTYGDAPATPQVTADYGASTAAFTYATSEDGEYSATLPTDAGTYWVKASIAGTAYYVAAEATASFTIAKRPVTVSATTQVVEVGKTVSTDLGQASLAGEAPGDTLSAVTLVGTSTATPTSAGTITPSDAVIANAAGDDMTSNYEITYVPARLVVAPAVANANGKAIYAMHRDIWMTVAEASVLCAAVDRDDQIIELADAHALLLGTGAELGVIVIDDGGLVAVVGDYELTLKANPELGVTVHVRDAKATDPDTAVTVYANDITPDADVVEAAKSGDADAIAFLIELAQAVAVDADGNSIPVTKIDLSGVDTSAPATYKVVYSTEDGASVTANLTLEGDNDDPKKELADKIKEAEEVVDPDSDPDGLTEEEKNLVREIEAARKVLDDPDATPDQIRDAIKRLDDAIAAVKAARGKAEESSGSGSSSTAKTDHIRPASGFAQTGDSALAYVSASLVAVLLLSVPIIWIARRRFDDE